MHDQAWLIPVLAVAAFAAFWAFVCVLIGMFGWRSLARHYRAQRPFEGDTRGMQSGMVSFARYNGVLTVGADELGLSLAVMPLFRPGHPPLFIPWHEVVGARHGRWLFTEYLELQFRLTGVKLRINGSAADFVRERARGAWPQASGEDGTW